MISLWQCFLHLGLSSRTILARNFWPGVHGCLLFFLGFSEPVGDITLVGTALRQLEFLILRALGATGSVRSSLCRAN